MPNKKIRILCVGAGHMGRAHALAYHQIPEFEIVGICTRSPESRQALQAELGSDYPEFSDFYQALAETKPDAVCISTYPDTHHAFAMAALEAGCHVFIEKPLAETVTEAEEIVAKAKEVDRKLVIGYILRHHPSWQTFIEETHKLGKPLVMRMNLNQQSSEDRWETHKSLMQSCSPIVDCGVHYVDVMCQMTRSKPIRVSGICARLTEEIPTDQFNYGQLQVTFEDGSVGWYEAGWGPMMSQNSFFIKDVVGPKGCVSIEARKSESDDVDSHTRTTHLLRHHSQLGKDGTFAKKDEWITTDDEPDHDGLCYSEQIYLRDAILHNRDLTNHAEDALNSMRIVAAADTSFRTGQTVTL